MGCPGSSEKRETTQRAGDSMIKHCWPAVCLGVTWGLSAPLFVSTDPDRLAEGA